MPFGIIVLLFSSLFCTTVGFAQAPSISWQKSLGGSEIENAYSIQQTSDGGYIVAGYSYSNDGQVSGHRGERDFWVVKLDQLGNIEWQKSLGSIADDEVRCIQQTTDGGYIVAGYTSGNGGDVNGFKGLNDYWIVKLDAMGNIQWQKPLGGTWKEEAFSIQQTTDGGYIVSGGSESNNLDVSNIHGLYDNWIVKLDSNGNIEWEKSLGGSGMEQAFSIRPTSDGGYIVASTSNSTDGQVTGNRGDYDYWIIKLEPSGAIEWQKSFGGTDADAALDIQQTIDGGYIVAGTSSSNDGDVTGNHGSSDYWVLKLDATGNIQWQKSMGGSGSDEPRSIQQTMDGGYVVGGYTNSTDGDVSGHHGYGDGWLVKLDAAGSIEWQKCLGGSGGEEIASLQQTNDGGFIIAGGSDSNDGDVSGNHGTSDFWVVKLCNSPPTPGNIAGIGSLCINDTISYTVPASIHITPYTWSVPAGWIILSGQGSDSITVISSANTGEVAVIANNTCGSSVPKKIVVTSRSPITPSIMISATTTNICPGSSITFTASANNGGTSPVYQWKKNGMDVGTNSLQYTDALLDDSDIISCELTSNEACVILPKVSSNYITLTKSPEILVSITSSAITICKNDEVTFLATTDNIGIGKSPIYQWQLNGRNVGSNNPRFATRGLAHEDQVTCKVLVQGNSCSLNGFLSNTITISLYPLPLISVTPGDTLVLSGSQVQLHALIEGNIASYEWEPLSSLIDPSILNPVTLPITATTEYWFNAASNDGCAIRTKVNIAIYNNLFIPDAFTPDGDGLNDVFRIPPNISLQLKDFSIYNRWGQKIFFTADIKKGWDGLNYPTGSYIYVVQGVNDKGPVFLKGTVTLIR